MVLLVYCSLESPPRAPLFFYNVWDPLREPYLLSDKAEGLLLYSVAADVAVAVGRAHFLKVEARSLQQLGPRSGRDRVNYKGVRIWIWSDPG